MAEDHVYIIAEIGFNHEADMAVAADMIAAASDAGADAVKFQTFRATDITLPTSPHYRAIRDMEMTLDQHRELAALADKAGVAFLSTPFSAWAVDLLEEVGVRAYKVASMDLTNELLLGRIAETGKPLYLSTGMSVLAEIDRALAFLREHGDPEVTLFHCLSKYPATAEQLNLSAISHLRRTFGVPVGYSDHFPGNRACLAAAMMGASVIETHFTLDSGKEGGDHGHSTDPAALKQLVEDIRLFEAMRGDPLFFNDRPDRPEASLFRRSIHAARDIAPGEVLTMDDLMLNRPGNGRPTADLGLFLGRETRRAVQQYEPLSQDDV